MEVDYSPVGAPYPAGPTDSGYGRANAKRAFYRYLRSNSVSGAYASSRTQAIARERRYIAKQSGPGFMDIDEEID